MIIVIFGTINSGKSTLAHHLVKKHHYQFLCSDEIAKTVMQKSEIKKQIKLLLHKTNPDLSFKMAMLTDIVFRHQINKLVWPIVHKIIFKKIQSIKANWVIETIDPVAYIKLKCLLVRIDVPRRILWKRWNYKPLALLSKKQWYLLILDQENNFNQLTQKPFTVKNTKWFNTKTILHRLLRVDDC